MKGGPESACTVNTQELPVAEESTHGPEVLLATPWPPSVLGAQSLLVGWYAGAQAHVIWYYVAPSGGWRGVCMPGGGPRWVGRGCGT